MGDLAGMLAVDARRRRKAEREAQLPLLMVQNQCTKILLQLDDPKDALAVVERIRRSIAEFIAAEASGHISAGRSAQ